MRTRRGILALAGVALAGTGGCVEMVRELAEQARDGPPDRDGDGIPDSQDFAPNRSSKGSVGPSERGPVGGRSHRGDARSLQREPDADRDGAPDRPGAPASAVPDGANRRPRFRPPAGEAAARPSGPDPAPDGRSERAGSADGPDAS